MDEAGVPDWVYDPTSVITYMDTTPLTKFEQAMVIGYRALQIGQNSKPRVAVPPGEFDPLEIAKQELQTGNLPAMSVFRYAPNGVCHRKSVADIYVRSRT